jgi:hypothetical protein
MRERRLAFYVLCFTLNALDKHPTAKKRRTRNDKRETSFYEAAVRLDRQDQEGSHEGAD